MNIHRITSRRLEENGYIAYGGEGGDCWIIDPGAEGRTYLAFLADHDLAVQGILLTHHHYDHVGAVETIRRETGCPVYIHRLDADAYGRKAESLEDGDLFDLAGRAIQVIHTPGHTRGSSCFMVAEDRICFTGDTIFDIDLGRTDLDDGSPVAMMKSIQRIIGDWKNDLVIYPGHGTTVNMAYVREHNQEFSDALAGQLMQQY